MFYPWFSTAGSATSRKDIEPSSQSVNSSQSLSESGNPTLALRFRSSNESFWEAAECCLIFAAIETHHGWPLLENAAGVMINPYFQVVYTKPTSEWLPFYQRFEHIFEYLQ